MRKIILMPILAAVFMMLAPAAGFAATEDSPFIRTLIAGQTIPVGEVRVWNDDTNIYVKYVITDDAWCLTATHLAVEQSLADIPKTKAGPVPGLFEYSDMMDCGSEKLYTIPLSWASGTDVYIAAHAVVQTIIGYSEPDLALFAGMLPAEATMLATNPYLGGPAYFPEINVNGDPLTGTYEGWCVSTALGLHAGVLYNANVFSSYETLPDGLVDIPGNLNMINWIINQQFVGKGIDCNPDLPQYTYGSVQRAIWELIDDVASDASLGPWSRCQRDTIIDAAYDNGVYYEPGCNEYVGVILQPFDSQGQFAQPVIVPVKLTCEPIWQSNTAWGNGARFTTKNWATYFTYRIEDEARQPYDMYEMQNADQVTEQKTKIENPKGIALP